MTLLSEAVVSSTPNDTIGVTVAGGTEFFIPRKDLSDYKRVADVFQQHGFIPAGLAQGSSPAPERGAAYAYRILEQL